MLTHTDTLRLPPASLEAEQAVLGALLVNNKALDRMPGLEAHHFADGVHGLIFTAIRRRIDAGRLADAVVMRQELEHTPALDEVGGAAYLAQLVGCMVGIVNAGEYAKLIHDCWTRRQVIAACDTAIERSYGADSAELQGGEILGALDTELAEVSREGTGGQDARDSSSVAAEVMAGFSAAGFSAASRAALRAATSPRTSRSVWTVPSARTTSSPMTSSPRCGSRTDS